MMVKAQAAAVREGIAEKNLQLPQVTQWLLLLALVALVVQALGQARREFQQHVFILQLHIQETEALAVALKTLVVKEEALLMAI
tara:strand:- start:636 stop:887 length:252 start_codon:yes stop_codon:yes gene_type:complete